MPRSIEGRVAAHQAASQRRAEGRPTWDRTLRLGDVFHNPDLTFPARRDAIVARLNKSGWPQENPSIAGYVDELATTATVGEFDEIWDLVYDEADIDRVWIETHTR